MHPDLEEATRVSPGRDRVFLSTHVNDSTNRGDAGKVILLA